LVRIELLLLFRVPILNRDMPRNRHDPETRAKVAAYGRQWYLENKEKTIAKSKKWTGKKKAWYATFRSRVRCCACKEKDPCCIDLHHEDPSVKEMNVSELAPKCSRGRLAREIAKCISLCKNCHCKLHAGRITITERRAAKSKRLILLAIHLADEAHVDVRILGKDKVGSSNLLVSSIL
jgi:hypothetical protein